jgi:hypothetical protein
MGKPGSERRRSPEDECPQSLFPCRRDLMPQLNSGAAF